MPCSLDHFQVRYWRDQLVAARDVAFRDAEGFQSILFTLEKIGQFLSGRIGTLGYYKPFIEKLSDPRQSRGLNFVSPPRGARLLVP
jgi:hypothetical protein